MTTSENKNTHKEICCDTQNHVLNQGMRCAIIGNNKPFADTIAAKSLVFLLYKDNNIPLKYTINTQEHKAGINSAQILWADKELQIAITEMSHTAKAILLIVPYTEIDTNQFDPKILTYELGYRSRLLLDQSVDNREKKSIGAFMAKSLFYELLYLQLEKIQLTANDKLKSHYEKAIMAKSIIDEDLGRHHTIPELAKAVGTNEQYLKTYFKQYYNKTISQYSTEMRMECAKKIILSGEYRIFDVARMTGYKHATHFTTAFKKYFGYKPNLLKKETKSFDQLVKA